MHNLKARKKIQASENFSSVLSWVTHWGFQNSALSGDFVQRHERVPTPYLA